MKVFAADVLYAQGRLRRGEAIAVSDDGSVAAVGPLEELARAALPGAPPPEPLSFPRAAILPGCVSAHSHCFQVLLRGRRPEPTDFADWVEKLLYPLVLELDEAALRAAALLVFSEMARSGITTVGEFHYIHNGPDGRPPLGDPNRLARVVIEAARSVGLRMVLLRSCYDTAKRPAQRRFAESPETAARAVRELATSVRGERAVTVMPAPHSLHGASAAMIRAAVTAADELGTRFHIHLAEHAGDLSFARETLGATPLRVLEALGALSRRTVVVHGLFLDDAERADLAAAGGALVLNPLTNQLLGDGTTDLAAVIHAGIPFALGTDADQAPCIFEEARALELAARAAGFRMGVAWTVSSRDGARALLDAATSGGGRALDLPVGSLAPGERADFVVIDLADPSLAPVGLAWADAPARGPDPARDLLAVMVSSLSRTAVRHVYVDGAPIVREGELVRLEAAAIHERLRAASL